MIKYPNSNRRMVRRDNTLKGAVNAGAVRVGQRFFVGDNPVTCVHIDGDKYIFSMDDIFKTTSHDKIAEVLETIWTTGMIDGINVIPTGMMQDIDFLFVPSERQVFGENKYGVEEDDEQFDWFKRSLVRSPLRNRIWKLFWGFRWQSVLPEKAEVCRRSLMRRMNLP